MQHAQRKAAEVLKQSLPYVSPQFHVGVVTDEYFEKERQLLARTVPLSVKLPDVSIDGGLITAFVDRESTLVQILDGKIGRLKPAGTESTRRELREELLRRYLAGQNVLAELRRKYAFLYERALQCKSRKEQHLAIGRLLTTAPPMESLGSTMEEYRRELAKECPALDDYAISCLVYEAVADWLLRCPLDFEEIQ